MALISSKHLKKSLGFKNHQKNRKKIVLKKTI